jgi:hypothetical protein
MSYPVAGRHRADPADRSRLIGRLDRGTSRPKDYLTGSGPDTRG